MDREEMIRSVYTDGYLESFMRSSLRPWMDADDFRQELALATCIAADRYSPDKGKWRSWVYWYWRSVRSLMNRNYVIRKRIKCTSISIKDGEATYDIEDRSDKFCLDLKCIEDTINSLPYIERRMILATPGECVAEFGMNRATVTHLRRKVRNDLRKVLGSLLNAR